MKLKLNAKNENVRLNGYDCDYISFGSGSDVLIMLPGVGDGFKTAKGVAIPFALCTDVLQRVSRYMFSAEEIICL